MENSSANQQPDAAPPDGEAETRQHLRGSALMLAGRLIALGVNFGTQVLLVRFLTKDDYGSFAYVLSLVLLGTSVARMGLDKALSRFVPIYLERRQWRQMAGTVVFVLAAILGLGGLLALLTMTWGAPLVMRLASSPLSASLLLMMVVLVPVEALENVLERLFAVFARPRALFFRRHILGPLLKLSAVLPLVFLHNDVYVLAGCYLAARVVGTLYSAVVLLAVLRRSELLAHFRPSKLSMPVRSVLGFSVPLLATDLAFALRTSLVTVLLEMMHGPLGVAAFRAVLPVARLNLVVTDSFKLLYSPTAARLFARNDAPGASTLYWKNAAWIAVATSPVFFASFALAGPLTTWLFGQRYADSGVVLTLLSLGCYLDAAFGFNAVTLRIHGHVRQIVVNDLAAAAVAIALNLLLIPAWGALGGALAMCGALLTQNVANQYALVRCGVVTRAPWSCIKVYASVAAVAATLLAIQAALAPPLYLGLALAAAGVGGLVVLNRDALDAGGTFPELLRWRPVRRLLGVPGE